jgi:hypothetical protein
MTQTEELAAEHARHLADQRSHAGTAADPVPITDERDGREVAAVRVGSVICRLPDVEALVIFYADGRPFVPYVETLADVEVVDCDEKARLVCCWCRTPFPDKDHRSEQTPVGFCSDLCAQRQQRFGGGRQTADGQLLPLAKPRGPRAAPWPRVEYQGEDTARDQDRRRELWLELLDLVTARAKLLIATPQLVRESPEAVIDLGWRSVGVALARQLVADFGPLVDEDGLNPEEIAVAQRLMSAVEESPDERWRPWWLTGDECST